jgi:hypothetical protein
MSDADRVERRLRLRRLLGSRRLLMAVVLLGVAFLVAGTSLVMTAYATPGTTAEQRVTETWSRSGTFGHSATVTEPNPAYDVGTVLRNRSTYLRPIAPEANVTYAVRYQASETGRVETTVDLRLVRRATDGDGSVLWEVSEPLATANRTLEPGERVRVPVTLEVTSVVNRTRNLSQQLGGLSGAETLVVAETRLNGRVNGERVNRRFTHEIALSVGGDTYSLSGSQERSMSFPTRETVTRERQYGRLYRAGGPLLLILGGASIAGMVLLRRGNRFELSQIERDWLAYREEYETYEEWIHTVSMPPGADSLPEAEAATLADLVDVAIDIEETVIEVPGGDRFHVVDDEYRYVYEPPRLDSATDRTPETLTDTEPESDEARSREPGSQ